MWNLYLRIPLKEYKLYVLNYNAISCNTMKQAAKRTEDVLNESKVKFCFSKITKNGILYQLSSRIVMENPDEALSNLASNETWDKVILKARSKEKETQTRG